MRRAVHLQHRAGSGRRGVHRVPVEVEVVAPIDHAAGRVGDHVDVRAFDRGQHPLRELGPRLTAPDVERGNHEVERGQELVAIVQLAVGTDLQLAPVEEPEPLG